MTITRYYDEKGNFLFMDNPGLRSLFKIDVHLLNTPSQIVHDGTHYKVVKVEFVRDVQFVTIRPWNEDKDGKVEE